MPASLTRIFAKRFVVIEATLLVASIVAVLLMGLMVVQTTTYRYVIEPIEPSRLSEAITRLAGIDGAFPPVVTRDGDRIVIESSIRRGFTGFTQRQYEQVERARDGLPVVQSDISTGLRLRAAGPVGTSGSAMALLMLMAMVCLLAAGLALLRWVPPGAPPVARAIGPAQFALTLAVVAVGMLASVATTWLFGKPDDAMTEIVGAALLQPLGALAAIVLAPIAEELLFRRWLQVRLTHDGIRHPIVAQAIVFALPHLSYGAGGLVVGFVGGLLFGKLYAMTGRLTLAVLAHAALNASTVVSTWMGVP